MVISLANSKASQETVVTYDSFHMGASSHQEMFVSKEIQIYGIIHYHIPPISVKFALLFYVRWKVWAKAINLTV